MIEASSQEEFDRKRGELSNILKADSQDKSALEPRRSVVKAQNEILDHWDSRFNSMIANLKEEIGQILAE